MVNRLELANEVTWTEDREHNLVAIVSIEGDLHQPAHEDQHDIAVIALDNDRRPATEGSWAPEAEQI